ncbi:MAG: hypothetical protein HY939_04035 [Gammaproteobacteria bacterium]|nr:hypothetical protein [Gammaproteobacteria bacterium]
MRQTILVKIQKFLYQRSREEQILILVFLSLLTLFAWFKIFLLPSLEKRKNLLQEIQSMEAKITETRNNITGLQKTPLITQYRALQKQSLSLDQQLTPYINEKVDHVQIIALLRSLLQNEEQLMLAGLSSNVLANKLSDEGAGAVYEEMITLEFTGNYFDTLAYLDRIKNIRWHWHVDSFSYKVQKYPMAIVTLKLSTLVRDTPT